MADARTDSLYHYCIASDGFSLGYTGAGFSLLKLKSDGTTIILASHSKEDKITDYIIFVNDISHTCASSRFSDCATSIISQRIIN